jgi:hypothetical protein
MHEDLTQAPSPGPDGSPVVPLGVGISRHGPEHRDPVKERTGARSDDQRPFTSRDHDLAPRLTGR